MDRLITQMSASSSSSGRGPLGSHNSKGTEAITIGVLVVACLAARAALPVPATIRSAIPSSPGISSSRVDVFAVLKLEVSKYHPCSAEAIPALSDARSIRRRDRRSGKRRRRSASNPKKPPKKSPKKPPSDPTGDGTVDPRGLEGE